MEGTRPRDRAWSSSITCVFLGDTFLDSATSPVPGTCLGTCLCLKDHRSESVDFRRAETLSWELRDEGSRPSPLLTGPDNMGRAHVAGTRIDLWEPQGHVPRTLCACGGQPGTCAMDFAQPIPSLAFSPLLI